MALFECYVMRIFEGVLVYYTAYTESLYCSSVEQPPLEIFITKTTCSEHSSMLFLKGTVQRDRFG
jgi:hypothetical protein